MWEIQAGNAPEGYQLYLKQQEKSTQVGQQLYFVNCEVTSVLTALLLLLLAGWLECFVIVTNCRGQ